MRTTTANAERDLRSVADLIDEEVARGERVLTPLGKKLLEARRRIEKSGIPMLTREEACGDNDGVRSGYAEGMSTTTPNAERDLRSVADLIDEEVARGETVLTELGKKLLESRRRIERSGIPMLTREEADREKAERRGGVQYDD